MKTLKLMIIATTGVAMLLTACDVEDPIYDTPHPNHGKITLTTDWAERGAGIDIPVSYTVKVGEYSAAVNGTTNTIDNLFVPENYRIHVHNTADNITVSGTTASVAAATASDGQPGVFVNNAPGWLFCGTMDVAIEKDKVHELTVAMSQQVRQLTFVIEPTGGAANQIESIKGYLSGVAGTLDIDAGTHGNPSSIALEFEKLTGDADAGKWSVTVRLLGTAGAQQRLYAQIRFEDNRPTAVTLDSDLSTDLAAFNMDKKIPFTLGGKVVKTPIEAGFTATIEDWKPVQGDSVVAN
ncbi:MAG TPA: FimB/Mfa2 family fimbrial subunit [Candidatus Butyricimonas faecavium]|mgnify:FL=1|nr:FimB/Mfa2 family fimbrial subunit [Candidatus Butyricimonas faecavium]